MRTVTQPHRESDDIVAGFAYALGFVLLLIGFWLSIRREDVGEFNLGIMGGTVWTFAVREWYVDVRRARRIARLHGK